MRQKQLARFAALAAAIFLTACSEEKSADKPIRSIKYVSVQEERIGETISQTGEIRPRYETAMSFRLDGLMDFRVDAGTIVKTGDVVASVDKTPSENNVATAVANLNSARVAVDIAELNAKRNWELFAKSVVSQAQTQQADANLQTAKAQFDAATTALANAKLALSYTELKAERDGIISAVGANQGQVVAAGQMVVTLISDNERDAVFDIPEQVFSAKLTDPEVSVSLVSDPSVTATGRVREVTPSADPTTRTYKVKVTLSGPIEKMPFGAAVVGRITVSPEPLVRIPASSLVNKDGASAVFVFDPSSKTLKSRDVKVARFDESTLYISTGLNKGDIVATAGVSKLRDGELVKLDEGAGK